MTRRSHGLANRPGEPYPATFHFIKWTHRESNPDLRHARAVSSRWTMSPNRMRSSECGVRSNWSHSALRSPLEMPKGSVELPRLKGTTV
jgi:hypothetical protein